MTRDRGIKNLAASVKARLKNLARERGEELQAILSLYARERLLYRLSVSEHRELCILKGAFLFVSWLGQPHRPTRDLDLLGKGDPQISIWEDIFREICKTKVEPDGLEFLAESVRGEPIKEDQEYSGIRIRLDALSNSARIRLQIDVGFGDAVVPAPTKLTIPSLLDFPSPQLKSYPREVVVAEKFQAMVMLGMTNTRMKDFYDIWSLSRNFTFDGGRICRALKVTFKRRKTALPDVPPLALTEEFSADSIKATQWLAFLKKGKLEAKTPALTEVVNGIEPFLMPPSIASATNKTFNMVWEHPQGWHEP